MSSIVAKLIRLCPYLLGFEIAFTLVFALVPSDSALLSFNIWDKAQHVTVFALLSITASLAYPNNRIAGNVGLLAFGAVIEIMQASLTTSRSGEFLDLVADGVGIGFGAIAYSFFRRSFPMTAGPRSQRLPEDELPPR